MSLRMAWLTVVGLASMSATEGAAAEPTGRPQVEFRESNPVVREFYETEKPLVEDGPPRVAPGKNQPEVTKDTVVAMGKYNEKEKRWEAGEEIPKGLFGDIFKDLGAKTIYVRMTMRDDRKAMSQILVTQDGDKGKK